MLLHTGSEIYLLYPIFVEFIFFIFAPFQFREAVIQLHAGGAIYLLYPVLSHLTCLYLHCFNLEKHQFNYMQEAPFILQTRVA